MRHMEECLLIKETLENLHERIEVEAGSITQVSSQSGAYSSFDNTGWKYWVILTYKFESQVELKFDPGFRVIGEYLSRIDNFTLNIE